MLISGTSRAYFPYLSAMSAAKVRLFCFPHAGGSAGSYRSWIAALNPEIEIVPVQLPGREQRLREAPLRSMPELVAALLEAIDPLLTDKPFAFFGHNLGAKVAFELTRLLASTARPEPSLVLVSASPAPHRNDPQPSTPAGLESDELTSLTLPYVRADQELAESYTARREPRVCAPIIAFAGRDDPRARPREVAAWAELTRSRFELRSFPGDQFYAGTAFVELASALRELLRPLAN